MNSKLKLLLALVVIVILAPLVYMVTRPKPVLVQAFYPVNAGHKYIVDYLQKVEKENPGKMKLEVYDMQDPAGKDMWERTGLGCAGVFVNGRTRHTITRPNGKKESIDFIKRMDSWWSKEDFQTVLKQEIAHPSPLPKGGFETGGPTAGPGGGPAAGGEGAGPAGAMKGAPEKGAATGPQGAEGKGGPGAQPEAPAQEAKPAEKGA